MTGHQLTVDDVLCTLESDGVLTTGAIAQRFHVTELDVHVLMLTVRANRLIYSTAAGEWAITDRGRQIRATPPRGTSRRPAGE